MPSGELLDLGLFPLSPSATITGRTLDADGQRIFVNLLGPFVVNADTGQGRQIVLSDQDLPIRAEVDLSR